MSRIVEVYGEECRKEGVEQGIGQGAERTLVGLVADGLLAAAEAGRRLGTTPERVMELVVAAG